MIFQWSKDIVSPQKNMEGPFYIYFSWQMGTQMLGALLHGGIDDQIMPMVREFHSCIF